MKTCAIIVNGFYTNDAIEHQVQALINELKELGVRSIVVKGDSLICHIEGEGCVTRLTDCDFAIYLDKDIHTAYMLEACGVRLFNSARAIELCDDKMRTYISLAGSGINMPYTVSSPIMYRDAPDGDLLSRVESVIPYPIVVKEAYGSMGRGVHLAKNRGELEELRDKLKLVPHLYQRLIGMGGEDKRVIVIGKRVVAAMRRSNKKDFRSNIEHGGAGSPTELTASEQAMAVKAAEVLGLDYCGVDILSDGEGNPYLCEVNSNAFFRGIQSVTGVNVAKIYAEYIFNKIYCS